MATFGSGGRSTTAHDCGKGRRDVIDLAVKSGHVQPERDLAKNLPHLVSDDLVALPIRGSVGVLRFLSVLSENFV